MDIGIRARNPATTKPRAPGVESRETYLPEVHYPLRSHRANDAR
jgi:hypothetical protein